MKRHIFVLLLLGTTFILSAQNRTITGVVLDAGNAFPVVGANVTIKGTTTGTTSDLDGAFALDVPEDALLTVTYIGYIPQDVRVGKSNLIKVLLKENTEQLDEVVVVGYGVQKKSVVTAAIGRVSSDNLKNITPTRVDNVLKGQTSGVTVTQASGQPGEGSQIRIRGIGTINNSDPLYIVDGMPIDGGIDFLHPSDIESIEVLKDGASGAVYGARAANGVILVTTKTGQAGRTTVSYDFSYGWQNAWKKRAVLDASQYQVLMNEMRLNSGQLPIYADPQSAGKGTDWQEELFYRNAPVMNNQVSINGGTEKGNYYFSTGYYTQDGIVGGNYDRSNYDRFNLRTNLNYTIFDQKQTRNWLSSMRFGTNMAYTRTKSKGISTNSEFGSPLGSALVLSPMLPVYAENPDGVLAQYPNAIKDKNGNVYTIVGDEYNEITNPLAQLQLPGARGNSDKFVASFWGELQLWDNLKFKTSFGTDLAFWGEDGWVPPYYLGKSNSKEESEVWSSMNRGYTWQLENVLSYQKTFARKHNVNIVLGQSAKKSTGRSLWGKNYGLQDLDDNKANIDFAEGTKKDQETAGGAWSPSTLASLFARVDYNYGERYMAQVTVRRDGSSKFGANNRFAVFPSFSLGWNLTNEQFWSEVPEWLSSAKIRYSWGKNGNENIEPFRYTTTMNSNNNYIFGTGELTQIVVGAKPNGLPNADLRWEESIQSDFGIDVSFFQNALTFTADYFNKKTNGMLMQMPLPSYVGDTPPLGNVGKMENSGLEFDLGYRFQVHQVNFRINANASYLRNKLIDLGNSEGWQNYDAIHGIGTITRAQNGLPFPYFYGKKTDGIFQNQAEIDNYVNAAGQKIQPKAVPGDVRFIDLNQDGKIDDDDRTKIGKGMPDWTFGLNIGIEWKGIDFSALFQGTAGNDVFDGTRRNDLKSINLPAYMLDRWTGEGTSNSIPRVAMTDDNGNWLSSDLFVKDGSFIRLKNIQLGYTIPVTLTRKAFIQNLRFYVAAENLLTLTKYDGFDPEISSGGKSLGVDRGVYPQARTVLVGANITF